MVGGVGKTLTELFSSGLKRRKPSESRALLSLPVTTWQLSELIASNASRGVGRMAGPIAAKTFSRIKMDKEAGERSFRNVT
jgi:hypothetical protein